MAHTEPDPQQPAEPHPSADEPSAAPPPPPPEPAPRRAPHWPRPLWPWLVLLVAAILGSIVGTRLATRGNSLLPDQTGQPLTQQLRPTIVVATASPATAVAAVGSPSPRPSPSTAQPEPEQQIYVVQPGDTMRSIAEQVYGDPALWPRIYDANRDVIGPNPDSLQPGTRLRIPPA